MREGNPYHCPYFNRVARRVVGPYFTSKGFELTDHASGALLCRRGSVVTELSYDADRVSELSPVVTMGTVQRRVPLWFVIPESDEARHHQLWFFRDENELAHVLGRLEREVLVPYVEPLWAAPDRLRYWLDRFTSSLDHA